MIRARLRGQTPPPAFRYKHAGDLATIGKRRAVIDFGWIKLRGPLAWWLWGLARYQPVAKTGAALFLWDAAEPRRRKCAVPQIRLCLAAA